MIHPREAARQEGKKTYNTGKPCAWGHMADRWVAKGVCCECLRLHLTAKRRAKGAQPYLRLREAARQRDEKTFNTGKPCKHGHLADRWTLNGNCCECTRLRSQSAYEANPVKHSASNQRWRQNNPEKIQAVKAAFRMRHLEEERARARQWHQDHPEKSRRYRHDPAIKQRKKETKRLWELTNPERVRAAQARYRALLAGAPGDISDDEVLSLLEAQGYQCAGPHCRTEFLRRGSYAVDHIVPLSRGGANFVENAQLLCKSCNSSKGAKTMDEWLVWLTHD